MTIQPLRNYLKQKKIRSSDNKSLYNSRSIQQDIKYSWITLFHSLIFTKPTNFTKSAGHLIFMHLYTPHHRPSWNFHLFQPSLSPSTFLQHSTCFGYAEKVGLGQMGQNLFYFSQYNCLTLKTSLMINSLIPSRLHTSCC